MQNVPPNQISKQHRNCENAQNYITQNLFSEMPPEEKDEFSQ